MPTIEDVINKARVSLPNINLERVRGAFEYVQNIHKDHYRFSGEPYVNHLLAVADTLIYYKPDESTLIAALMHDISQGEPVDLEEVEKTFGAEVVSMVEALEKINNVSLRKATTDPESLRKMFLSMAGDLRVVLIRMADRLQNMETLDFVDSHKRKRIARETMDIYVPILARLGIYKMKWRLEDLAFKYLHPEEYTHLSLQLEQYLKRQVEIIDFIQSELQVFLRTNQIEAKVEGRLKNIYSIYKKLKKKNHTSLTDIFDIFAIRIILPTRFQANGQEMTEHLYAILGLIHNKWVPLADRFKDYVALPKPNGYQSLHTTVLGLTPQPINQPTEIQIRSERMHEESNFGLASHWLYKEDKSFSSKVQHDAKLEILNRLHRSLNKNETLVQPLKVDVFEDRIFVLTPDGDIKDLPNGSTPIDFAYAIHTDIGHRCYGAKVNNQIVPLSYQLRSGAIVNILLHNEPDPKLHWLSFVKTMQAKTKIKSYFKSLDKDQSFRDGKVVLNKLLIELGHSPLDDSLSLLKKYENKKLSLKQRSILLAEVGNGALLPQVVLKKIFGEQIKIGSSQKKLLSHPKPVLLPQYEEPKIFIGGAENVPYQLSSCCKPQLGEDVLAFISRGKSVRIHLQSCKLLKHVDQSRILEATWDLPVLKQKRYPLKIMLQAVDRVGLIRDIADVVASFNVNIIDFALQERKDNMIRRLIIVEVSHQEQFEKILKHLQHIRSVLKVEKVED